MKKMLFKLQNEQDKYHQDIYRYGTYKPTLFHFCCKDHKYLECMVQISLLRNVRGGKEV